MKGIQDKEITEDKRDLTETVKKYIVPCILLVILAVIVSWITFIRVKTQINVGPGWDTFAFLANALEFAGKGIGYSEPTRPPFLSFLTSIPFRLGYLSESTIFFVDGIVFVFGVIGLYLLFKLRFDSISSLFGSLLYVSFPIVLQWMGTGYTDVASVSFSIWAIYCTVLAMNKDSKFFYLAFPFFIIASLTRYTAGLIILPMFLYIVISGNYLEKIKDIFIGVLLSILTLIPFLWYFNENFGDPIYPLVSGFMITEGSSSTSVASNSNVFYFLERLPEYMPSNHILPQALIYILITIIIIGIVIYSYDIIKKYLIKIRVKSHVQNLLNLKEKTKKIKILVIISLLTIFVLTFGKVSYITSEILFFVFCYVLYNILNDIEDIPIDLLFLSWFMTFFIFHSNFAVKDDRYFVTIVPAFVFFIVLGLNQISKKLKISIKNINITSWIISVILIFAILTSTCSYINDMPQEQDYIVSDAIRASQWFINYDPDYDDKLIYSDIWPAMSWDLKTDIKDMPTFKDPRAFNHELEKYNVDYYFAIHGGMNLTSYEEIARFGTVIIYKKNPNKFENKTRMIYIGKNWQNYIEDVLDFRSFVIYEPRAYNLNTSSRVEESSSKYIYLDEHSLESLKHYKYMLLYNFAWYDQKKAENLILDYANSGGTVVIDASRNLDGVYYNLDNSIFLGMKVTKKSLRPNPTVWINPKSNMSNITFSPFLSDGDTWVGADYEPFGNTTVENLVTVDGRPLIAVQKVGKGKIIWISYNFVWHAFHLENEEEMELIQKVIFGS